MKTNGKTVIDTTNLFLVGVHGKDITILSPKKVMSRADALLLAAWLVALAEQAEGEFEEILKAVKNT